MIMLQCTVVVARQIFTIATKTFEKIQFNKQDITMYETLYLLLHRGKRTTLSTLCWLVVLLPYISYAQSQNYNLIYIMVDDLGKEWISAYGADGITTPNIDALANEGMKFNNFYCMPQCTPTRVALLTGQYPFRNGWVNHWDVPRWGGGCSFDPQKNPCFPNSIRDAGYRTAIAGKWQIDDFRVEPDAMQQAGFDEHCMWTGYETGNKPSAERYQNPYIHQAGSSTARTGKFGPDVFTDFIVDFIGHNKEHPMMIYFPMVLTHGPWVATPDQPNVTSRLDKHIAMVRYMDKIVGRIVQAVDDNNLREQTIIIFTTDNGSSKVITGSINGRKVKGAKSQTSEGGICVPFIANCPGQVPQGIESNALIDITDIAPTFCEIAGIKNPDSRFDGKSFADVLFGQSSKSKRDWIMSMGGGNHAKLTDQGVENQYWFRDRVIRNERYKLFVGTDRQPKKLIDLQNDAAENKDLLDSKSKEVESAKEVFMKAINNMPKVDADPAYTPLEQRDWYLKPTAKSQVWKKGSPNKG